MSKPVNLKMFSACMAAIRERRQQVLDSDLYLDAWLVVSTFGGDDESNLDCTLDCGTICATTHDDISRIWLVDNFGKIVFETTIRHCVHENQKLSPEARSRCVFIEHWWVIAYIPGAWEQEIHRTAKSAREAEINYDNLLADLENKWGIDVSELEEAA